VFVVQREDTWVGVGVGGIQDQFVTSKEGEIERS
jgi:hypothetical protein